MAGAASLPPLRRAPIFAPQLQSPLYDTGEQVGRRSEAHMRGGDDEQACRRFVASIHKHSSAGSPHRRQQDLIVRDDGRGGAGFELEWI